MLLQGLLEGVTVGFAGEATEVAAACSALGAATPSIAVDLQDEEAVAVAVEGLGALDALVCATEDLDAAFIATRSAATVWIAAERGGKVVLIAPRDDAPQRAALENLARTLSIEWSRYQITTSAILPGEKTSDAEVGELVAFIASPAGDYYSGCAFTLGNAHAA